MQQICQKPQIPMGLYVYTELYDYIEYFRLIRFKAFNIKKAWKNKITQQGQTQSHSQTVYRHVRNPAGAVGHHCFQPQQPLFQVIQES